MSLQMDKLAEDPLHGGMGADDSAPPPDTDDDDDGPLIVPSLGTVAFEDIPTTFSVPPGPLATADEDSGLSAEEELKQLYMLVSDIVPVCQAVTRGDLSRRVTVSCPGAVTRYKDVVNTMVWTLLPLSLTLHIPILL